MIDRDHRRKIDLEHETISIGGVVITAELLARTRQHLAASGHLSALPTWEELTEDERRTSVAIAAAYVRTLEMLAAAQGVRVVATGDEEGRLQ
jgi:hypothetical protein